MKNYLFCFSALICTSVVILSSCSNDSSGYKNDSVTKQRLVSEINMDIDRGMHYVDVYLEYDYKNRVSKVTYIDEYPEHGYGETSVFEISYYDTGSNNKTIEMIIEDRSTGDSDLELETRVNINLNRNGYIENVERNYIHLGYTENVEYLFDKIGRLVLARYDEADEYTRETEYGWENSNVVSVLSYTGDYNMESKLLMDSENHNLINVDLNRFILMADGSPAGITDYGANYYIWFLGLKGTKSANYITNINTTYMFKSDSDFLEFEEYEDRTKLTWMYDNGYPVKCQGLISSYEDGKFDDSAEFVMKIKYRN